LHHLPTEKHPHIASNVFGATPPPSPKRANAALPLPGFEANPDNTPNHKTPSPEARVFFFFFFFFFFKVILNFLKTTGAQGGVEVSGSAAVATQLATTAPMLTIHISLIVVDHTDSDYRFSDPLQPASGSRFWSVARSHLTEIRVVWQPLSSRSSSSTTRRHD
jgi:hypothetical protein